MRRPHDPNGGRFHLPEPGLYLVLIRDPYEEPSYDDICYVCDGDHLDGFVGRLHDAGFPLEDIRVVRCGSGAATRPESARAQGPCGFDSHRIRPPV